MKYLAHIRENGTEQSVLEHLKGTAVLAEKFGEKFGDGELCGYMGLLHDIGKYSEEFQNRIQNHGPKVDHATAGMKAVIELGQTKRLDQTAALIMAYGIGGHHSGLMDAGSCVDPANGSSFWSRTKKMVPDYSAYRDDLTAMDFDKVHARSELTENGTDTERTERYMLDMAMEIKMAYSCLVDADFLDTERFMNPGIKRPHADSIELLRERFQEYIRNNGWLNNTDLSTVAGHRTQILKNCIETGKKSEKGFFTMTVPTGGGKTASSMAFALEHAIRNHHDRIIYVIPYTSIIEQNAAVFKEMLGKMNVLEHHSNFDFSANVELEQLQLATENWDMPIVLTTNVQFFESLYSCRSSGCRKLHNIADSVIVFDEAQKLPAKFLKPCLEVMAQLVRNYGSSVVLCTATQPALEDLMPEAESAVELCPDVNEQFKFFDRVDYEISGDYWSLEELAERMSSENQALCIVNTRNQVRQLYDMIKREDVYHLSTTMVPADRLKTIEKVKARLKAGKKCLLIATSIVEAGVDLDFEKVYRQFAPVDSIIQAAGRSNREGKRSEKGRIIIFHLEDERDQSEIATNLGVTRSLLERDGYDSNIFKENETIRRYFFDLYKMTGEFLDQKKILEKTQKMYFREASKDMRLIDDWQLSMIIPNEEIKAALDRINSHQASQSDFRIVQKNVVKLPERVVMDYENAGLAMRMEALEDTWLLLDKGKYSEQAGLQMEINGNADLIF